MDSVFITLLIMDEIEKALELGYTKLYMNVDDLENTNGFIRVLAMKGPKYIILYEGTLPLVLSYQVLDLLARSKFNIKDFTIRRD